MHRLLLVVTILLALSAPAHAQSLDAASTEALAAALRALQDPSARAAALSGNPQGGAVDQQIQGFAGGLTPDVYALAAQVLNELVRNTGGDVGRLSDAIGRARTDPSAFAATLSPATLDRLRELATRIGDQRR
jgi:hypothetical protein